MLVRRTLLAAMAAATVIGGAAAQDWPTRQVTIVVPFAAGGTTDLFARIFANAMQAKYNQPFVVENKGGAGGTIGAAAAAKSPNDGYTLFVGTGSTHAMAPFVYRRPGYDADKDFAPISRFAIVPGMLIVSPKMPVANFKEFVAYVKANDGKLSFGSSGVGSANHIPAEVMARLIGAKMTHVPYRSSNEIMNAIAGGHVDMAFDNITFAWPQAQGGTAKALAVTTKDRSPTAPDVPTIAETFPGYDIGSWHGLFAPAGAPRAVVDRLAADVKEIYSTDDVKKKLFEIGAVSAPNTPEEFTQLGREEREKYKKIVAETGLAPQ
jgi:tripartite-type tricarboxylate transporter receptor subunit TctC